MVSYKVEGFALAYPGDVGVESEGERNDLDGVTREIGQSWQRDIWNGGSSSSPIQAYAAQSTKPISNKSTPLWNLKDVFHLTNDIEGNIGNVGIYKIHILGLEKIDYDGYE